MNGESWQSFVEFAAYVRGNPRFEPEERDRNLDAARKVRALLQTAREGAAIASQLPALFPVLCNTGRPYDLTTQPMNDWLEQWATANEGSFRQALAAFASAEEPAQARFGTFADAARNAQRAGLVAQHPRAVLTWGSLFNFALSPTELPVVHAPVLDRLERDLGVEPAGKTASLAERYETHLAFAQRLQADLAESGVPIEDMLDVQGLAFVYFNGVSVPPRDSAKPGGRRPVAPDCPYLSICSCLGYEAPYILEWVELHRLVGVERFFLYNNGDRQAQRALLAPYIERGIVVLHEWPQFPPQFSAYAHCLEEHREDSRWIAFLDADEFLFSPTGEPLPAILREYEEWPGVGANWATFGTSGHRTKPLGLVIESYTQRLNNRLDRLIKSIVDPIRTERALGPHAFAYLDGAAMDENRYPIGGGATVYVSSSRLRVNHYLSKSEDEFRSKLAQREALTGGYRSFDVSEFARPPFGFRDTTILRYLPALREALKSLREGRARA